ncbi:MAG: hypothetical protein M3Q95_12035 [Bacteroidota bacterium]|nr:hypothetical protein [Bacteroidota bacterium]
MKKFFIYLICFLLFTIGIYLVFIWISGNALPLYLRKNLSYRVGAYGHMNSRMREVRNYENTDVLILGSSHAYRGIDIRYFEKTGINAFNLGSSSQTPQQSLMLLRKYFDQLRPRLVILEVFPEIFTLDGVESSLDLVANDVVDRHMLQMVLKVNHVKTYNAFTYSWLRQCYGSWDDFVEPVTMGKDTYIKGGFVDRKSEEFKYINHTPLKLNFHKEQIHALNEIVNFIETRSCQILLVQAPVTKSFYQSMHYDINMDSLMQSQARYVNFNGNVALDDSLHFYDPDHLNREGVRIFNKALLQYIEQENLLNVNAVKK